MASQQSTAASTTISVKVNGQPVEAPRFMPHPLTGKPTPTTMIQACELAKVMVPHYCYHPKLPVAGNCRICLVEYGTPALGPVLRHKFSDHRKRHNYKLRTSAMTRVDHKRARC